MYEKEVEDDEVDSSKEVFNDVKEKLNHLYTNPGVVEFFQITVLHESTLP